MVVGGDAVERHVPDVGEADLLQAVQSVTVLGEEKIVGLDALEGQHPERVVREVVDEERVAPGLQTSYRIGRDRPALADEDDRRFPAQAGTLQTTQDESLEIGRASCRERV